MTVHSIRRNYGNRGNLVSEPQSGKTYGYSSENLMTSASGGTSATLTYDPLMRLYQDAGAATTRFAYDGAHMIAEYDSAGALTKRYVFGPGADEPLVQYDVAGTRTWMTSDERGSIVALSDDNGAVTAKSAYDEYGKPAAANQGRFQYTGQAWLSEVGLQYSRARIYSPTLGRFLQTDPIGYGDGLNWYAYVHNDPVNMVDPLGLKTCGGDVPDANGNVPMGPCAGSVGDVGGFGSGGGFGGILFAPGNSATALKQIMDNAKRWAWAGKGRPKRGHLPSDAIRCTAGGVSFWAPPSFNVPEIYLAGEEGGSTGVSEGYAAVGQAGEFDFQRSVDLAGNPVFISSYTNASNFAVGAYLAGAGYGQASGGAISNTYAFFRSSNFGDPKQAQFRNLGMDVASGRLRLNCRR